MSTLNLITIYEKPIDFPLLYVARRFEMEKPTNEVFSHEDLSVVRQWCRDRLRMMGQGWPMRMPRDDGDEKHILETWL